MKKAPIAKIARPKLSGIVKRDRLFHLLDQTSLKPVIWIDAQAGSGKTTLIASWLESRQLSSIWYQIDEGDTDIASFFYYLGMAAKHAAPRYKKSLPLLTPEYIQGIPVFTRRYFEQLFLRLKTPSVIVLDNYQNLAIDSKFHDMIAYGMDAIPEGSQIIILSRVAAPPQFARLHANNRLQLFGWEEMRFTKKESASLLEIQGCDSPAAESLELLHDKTEGWAAGLIMLTAGAGTATFKSSEEVTTGSLFNYFANEIFGKTDASIQDVLLKTSFLQIIDPSVAEILTENAMAGQILERMNLDHYFTQKYGQTYQYHPLFREFLQGRVAAVLPAADIKAIQKKAAKLMEEFADKEEATRFYLDAADWINAERMVLEQAPVLVSQGRGSVVEGWLKNLPQQLIENSPWALYWLGICRMAYNPAEARRLFERAFLHFRENTDVSGLFLSWACIVETFVYEWGDFSRLDHWIAVADKLIEEHPVAPTPEIEARVAAGMLNALTWRQPRRSDLPAWAEHVRQIAFSHPDAQLRIMLGSFLIIYYLWIGEFAKAGLLIDTLRPASARCKNDPLTQQNWNVMEAMYAWFNADSKTCFQAIKRGLKNAEESGIHLLDLYLLGQGVYGGLSLGDTSAAESCLKKMSRINSPRLMDKSFYQYQASSVAWQQGDLKKAIEQGKLAVEFAEKSGCPLSLALCQIELANTLFDDRQYEEASSYLAQGAESGQDMNGIQYLYLLSGARFAFGLNDEKQGIALLQQGLALGAQQGYSNMPRWNDTDMSILFSKALEQGIQTGYVQRLIQRRGLESGMQQQNKEEATRLAALAFESNQGMMVTDAHGVIMKVNSAFTNMTGYSEKEALGRTPHLLKSGRQNADFYAAMWESIGRTGSWHGEIWNRRKNGEIYPEQLTITAVKDATGAVTHYVSTRIDITERKMAETDIHNLAYYDPLTRLPNRRLLNDRLEQTMAASKRSGLHGALMFLDLDNFKPLNDKHGHEVGDQLLTEAAQRITRCVREMDTVARFGGDEFVVLLSELDLDEMKSRKQAHIIAEKIRTVLAQPYLLTPPQQGNIAATVEHHCTTSIGVTLFTEQGKASGNIIKQADMAMYQAKKDGRNSIRFVSTV